MFFSNIGWSLILVETLVTSAGAIEFSNSSSVSTSKSTSTVKAAPASLTQAASSCAAQYDAWSTSSLSFSYSAYLSARKTKDYNPFASPTAFPEPSPSCCEPVFDQITAAQVWVGTSMGTSSFQPASGLLYPPCGHECEECDIQAWGVGVIHWHDSFNTSGTSEFPITKAATPDVLTLSYGTTTLTSPTLYLVVGSVYANNGRYLGAEQRFGPCSASTWGGTYTTLVYPIASDSSLSKTDQTIDNPASRIVPLDYTSDLQHDFTSMCGSANGKASPEKCATINLIDPYWQIVQPLEIHDQDPAWENCSFSMMSVGMLRPPHILNSAIPLDQQPDPTSIDIPPLATPAPASRTTMFSPPTATDASMPDPTPLGQSSPFLEPIPNPQADPKTGTGSGTNQPPNPGNDESGPNSPITPSKANNTAPAAVITLGSSKYTCSPSGIILPASTLSPGNPAITISSHTISIATNGAIVDGSLTPFHKPTASGAPKAVEITIGTLTYTAHPTGLVIPTILRPGDVVRTISGHRVSIATNGIVVDGTLKSFTAPAPSAASSSRGAMDPVASAVMYPFTHDWNSHTTVSDISSTGTAEISATAATTSSTVNRNGNGNDILALGGGNRILNRLGIRISVLLITVWVL